MPSKINNSPNGKNVTLATTGDVGAGRTIAMGDGIRLRLVVLAVAVHLWGGVSTRAEPWTAIAPNIEGLALPVAQANGIATTKRFVALSTAQTGIDFVERLDWEHPQGQLFYIGFACGGIAVGDVDGNGLPDLFFAGGSDRSRLYFQRTPWKFEEDTAGAGIASGEHEPWSTGATLFDIDNDGDLDLYVCNYDAANRLYVNRGDGTFDERAAEYGLDIVDASLMASVADYDRDGDLDLYLAMNRYLDEKSLSRRDLFYRRDGMELLRPEATKYFLVRRHIDQPGQLNMWAGRTDRLLRNEGPGRKFVDSSAEMGLERGDTLSATWWDYDHDGWPDLYVANDLAAPDRLFHNRGDGSFEDGTLQCLPHTPWQAMGASTGDINNDGLVDCLVADMSFRTHFKDKVFMGDMSTKFRNISVFPHDQLMRNALFVNTGTQHFQEAAYLTGLASTDWTWTAKLADFDNDGRLDAYFTNGSPVNLANSAEPTLPASPDGAIDLGALRKRYRNQPPVLEQNLAFRNLGDLKFADRSDAWGLDEVGMSFGAVHADLDRDGDLDLVVANLDRPPSILRNESQAAGTVVELQGTVSNRRGVGAEIVLETSSGSQVRQVSPVAGFQSCQENTAHFGLAAATSIRRMTVRWPSGIEQEFDDLPTASRFRVTEPASTMSTTASTDDRKLAAEPLFSEFKGGFVSEHHEEPFDDFARQPLLPNRLSQFGPPMAWADVDGDGDQDCFVGEGRDWMGILYLNQGDLSFKPSPQIALSHHQSSEDSAALFFDANSDGHVDLYVGSGSVEHDRGDERMRDRLYLGGGKGGFDLATGWLPDLRRSTGAVAASDFDHDGDLDLFVGSRSVPGEYPVAPEHALLVNDSNRFVDALARNAPELANAGMVTAATWIDVDHDGWDDLLVATDWGPMRLYHNQSGQLVERTVPSGLAQWTGWWHGVATGDFDHDGDTDFVAGNFGLNTKYHASIDQPVLAYYGAYSDSDRNSFVEASYEGATLFPLRGKSCSSAAMPHLAKRFPSYEQFAKATLAEIYTPECLKNSQRLEVNTLETSCFLNDGRGNFERFDLPREVQLAPVFAIAVTDVNGDGVPDLYCGQNFFGPQRETGPMDGGVGVVAIGRGDGTFEAMRPDRAGIAVAGDTKAVAAVDLDGDGRDEICVANNEGPLQVFSRRPGGAEVGQTDHSTYSRNWLQHHLGFARQFAAASQPLKALPSLRKVLKIDPTNATANLMLASVRREQGRFRDSAKLLDRLADYGEVDRSLLLSELGRMYFDMQQYNRAAQAFTAALALKPTDVRILMQLGELRQAQGDLRSARRHFQAAGLDERLFALQQVAQVAEVAFDQGVAAQQSGDDGDAIKHFRKSLRLDARPETMRRLAKLLQTTEQAELRDEWLAEQLLRWSAENRRSTASE